MRLFLPHIKTIVLALACGVILFTGGPFPCAAGALPAAGGASASARAEDRGAALPGKLDGARKTLVIDGSCVQYAGNLQMNVTNFGFLGSMPGSRMPMSDSPSAQWPAGSGIEYLYAAGIWIGAERTGVPAVSTGYPETELYPSSDPRDVIYRTAEGAKGGGNYPGRADDDGDGRVNEDWLNGRDDDGDGRMDEDYAAIGNLMYVCRYSDTVEVAKRVWPEHSPLGIEVRQETFQWSEKQLYNFVGVHYSVMNIGNDILENVHAGIYADLDAGPRNIGNYFRDDMIGTWEGIWCAKIGEASIPVRFSVVYVYDADGDGGRTPGYFGLVLLGSWMRTSWDPAPVKGRLTGIRIFTGLLPFDRGGEPVNDFERYSALSDTSRDANTVEPNDYKVLMSLGPFSQLMPGASIEIHAAYACGEGLAGLLDNAAMAAYAYRGIWYNVDRRPQTGINGRETPVAGPADGLDPDVCDGYDVSIRLRRGDTLWTNADCAEEREFYNYAGCYRGNLTFRDFQTGIDGKEAQIHWVTSTAPPPPAMRAVAGDAKVTLFWDNLSEITRDVVTLRYDFEGYQIWRADDWHRPIGTTAASGPSADLWHLVENRDLVNGLPPDSDFKRPFSEGGFEYEPLARLESRTGLIEEFEALLRADPLAPLPCPPGLTSEECDTLGALARWNLGLEGGRQYYEYVDTAPKNGMPYFYAVVAYDNLLLYGRPEAIGVRDTPISNFVFVEPHSPAQAAGDFHSEEIYVVPNPVTKERMAPWTLEPNNRDPSGEKLEFRNLPKCRSTVRIYTIAGDLVATLSHDGGGGNGTLAWNMVSRNGQSIASGVYLFSVEPEDGRFRRVVGKFVVIR
jgi:hypothetical protein